MDKFGFSIDSEYMEAQHLFEEDPDSAQKEVLVWTESDDDIRLWMHVFTDNEKYKFSFMPASRFKDDGNSANGCSRLIKLCDNGSITPGPQNIICLDSDFKFIACHNKDYAGRNYQSMPHFFWTIVHSKEHFFLGDRTIDSMISHSACSPVNQLKQLTRSVYEAASEVFYEPASTLAYLISLELESLSNKTEAFKVQFRDALFNLLKIKKGYVNFETCENWKHFKQAMKDLNLDLRKHIANINKDESLTTYQNSLNKIGITNKNIYLFTRGHDWEAVVRHITKCHLEHLLEAKIQDLKQNPSKNLGQEIQAIKNKIPKIDQSFLSERPDINSVPFFATTIRNARNTYSL